jgi:prepilin-type N-terminal cleavage/methylation domain-containing protein
MSHSMSKHPKLIGGHRCGFTLMEVGVSLAVLSVCMLLVMQLGYLSLRERSRRNDEQIALECAANVLEAARAEPWESLTPEWATAQELPEPAREQLADATMSVTIEPEPSQALTKRVTVVIRTKHIGSVEVEAARLVALISARTATNGD